MGILCTSHAVQSIPNFFSINGAVGTLGATTDENRKQSGLKSITGAVGQYVSFLYEDNIYPGMKTSLDKDRCMINAMVRSLKFWNWPEKCDEI